MVASQSDEFGVDVEGGLPMCSGFRDKSSVYAVVIWWRAKALSKGVMGMSPQSRTKGHEVYGFTPARWLKLR